MDVDVRWLGARTTRRALEDLGLTFETAAGFGFAVLDGRTTRSETSYLMRIVGDEARAMAEEPALVRESTFPTYLDALRRNEMAVAAIFAHVDAQEAVARSTELGRAVGDVEEFHVHFASFGSIHWRREVGDGDFVLIGNEDGTISADQEGETWTLERQAEGGWIRLPGLRLREACILHATIPRPTWREESTFGTREELAARAGQATARVAGAMR